MQFGGDGAQYSLWSESYVCLGRRRSPASFFIESNVLRKAGGVAISSAPVETATIIVVSSRLLTCGRAPLGFRMFLGGFSIVRLPCFIVSFLGIYNFAIALVIDVVVSNLHAVICVRRCELPRNLWGRKAFLSILLYMSKHYAAHCLLD